MDTFHVYCDESHVGGSVTGFRIQGGIWVPDHRMRAVRGAFRELRERHPTIRELKWEYVTGTAPMTVYRELIDLFFSSPVADLLSFKCLVVQRGDDASRTLDKVGKDIGFYKAYYTLLRHRLAAGSTNHVRLDGRSGPRSDAEGELAKCLNNASASQMWTPFTVASCAAVSSKSEDLIQLADVLCGAVGWAWNGMQSTCGAKPLLHAQITTALRWSTLVSRETGRAEPKFNVWRYRPQGK